jgi:hypothetical protein
MWNWITDHYTEALGVLLIGLLTAAFAPRSRTVELPTPERLCVDANLAFTDTKNVEVAKRAALQKNLRDLGCYPAKTEGS